MSIDISKLDSFAKEVYSKIIARHPEWDKYAKVDPYKYPGGECFYLSIEIPPPIPGVFPIDITDGDDEPDELTIYFGPAHFHMRIYLRRGKKTIFDQLNGIEKITRQIFDEELIAVQGWPGFFFIGEGMVTQDQYKKMLDKGKLRRAVSWKGTYNYPKDGTHLEWNPPKK